VGGTRLRLRVVPGAKRSGIIGRHGNSWKIRVAAPPEAGAANDAVLALLAAALGIRPRDIRLVSGHASRDKIVELTALGLHEAELLLASTNGEDA
jgi:uncharacterized protein